MINWDTDTSGLVSRATTNETAAIRDNIVKPTIILGANLPQISTDAGKSVLDAGRKAIHSAREFIEGEQDYEVKSRDKVAPVDTDEVPHPVDEKK